MSRLEGRLFGVSLLEGDEPMPGTDFTLQEGVRPTSHYTRRALHPARPEYMLHRVGAAGFEPAKALPPDLQSGPIGRSGTPPNGIRCRKVSGENDLPTELAVGVEPTTAGLQNRSSAIEPR